jgi:hypothetical protein
VDAALLSHGTLRGDEDAWVAVHGLERPWVRWGEVIGGWRVAAPWYGCVWICRERGGETWNLEAVRGACWCGGSVALLVSHRVVLYFVAWGRGIKRYLSRALCLIFIILQIHIAQSISPLLLSCTLTSSPPSPPIHLIPSRTV